MRGPVRSSLLALTLCACHACPPGQPARADLLHDVRQDEFPGAAALLAGFDPIDDGADLRAGDRCLFGLRFADGDTRERWLLDVQVLDPAVPLVPVPASIAGNPETIRIERTETRRVRSGDVEVELTTRKSRCQLAVRDAQGTLLGETSAELPRDLLRAGFREACRVLIALGPRPRADAKATPAQLRACLAPLLGTICLMDLLREDAVLSPWFWRVVRKPVSLSMLFGIETTVHWTLAPKPAGLLPAWLPDVGEAYVVPMQVTVNDIPVLDLQILTGSSASPLALTGGVIGLEAVHPTNPGLRLQAVLLAARRGPAAAAPR